MKPALIIGNGPSVDVLDPSLLKHFVTFGSNHIYKKFSEWGRETDNVVITDYARTTEIGSAYAGAKCQLYVGNERRSFPHLEWTQTQLGREFTPLRQLVKPLLKNLRALDFISFHHFLHPLIFDKLRFSFSFERGLNFGYSVVISALQIAVMKGHKTILLTGVDSSYPTDKAYFSGMEESVRWVNRPFIENPRMWMEPLLVNLQIALEGTDVRIVDCTPGGKLRFIAKGELAAFAE